MALVPYTGKLEDLTPVESGDDDLGPAPGGGRLRRFTGDVRSLEPVEQGGGAAASTQDKGFTGHARDLGLSALKSAIAVPEAVVGLADIPTGGAVGKFLENKDGAFGFRPKEAKEILSDLHTDQYKAQQREFQDADGVLDKTAVALQNPSLIANTVVESAAPMLAGGVAARGIRALAPGVSTAAAGAMGEGAMMAGSQAEGIRQQTDDGLLTAGQSGAAVATGALGTLFGYAGGRLAQRLGVGDVDTLLARGAASADDVAGEIARLPAKSIPRQVIEGAITEGFLEELPQSISEQIIQNLALGKTWSEGVEDAAVMGTLAGMAMGGGASLARGLAAPPRQDERPALEVQADPQPAGGRSDIFSSGDAPILDERALEAAGVTAPPPAPVLNPGQIDRWADLGAAPAAAPKPSEQMGLDPAAGPLSAAAAQAVDSGASPVVPAVGDSMGQMAEGVAPAARDQHQAPAHDPETGEIIDNAPADRAAELQARLAFVEQQSRMSGWDQRLIDERERVRAELAAIAPEAGAADAGDRAQLEAVAAPAAEQTPAARWAAMTAEDRAAVAGGTDLAPVIRRNLPAAQWERLNPTVQAKLEQAMQAQASPPPANGAPSAARAGDQIERDQAQSLAQPAGGPVLGTAEAAPAFDVAGRSDAQLQHLATSGRPGWREAAQAEIARRAAPAAGTDGAASASALGQGVASATTAQGDAAATAVQSPGPAAPAIDGRDLGDGWAAFGETSGTLGVPRAEMPQIRAEHRGAMVKFMNARGVAHREETVDAATLKPTQAEFNREKVAKAKARAGGERSILVSADGHVLDGHHQWLAAREAGEPVKAIRLDAPIRDLITLAHAFPSSSTDAASAAPARSGPKKPRGVLAKKAEAEAKARADYFTPGNVVPSFGGFDRVLSYQPPDADGRWSVTVRAVEKQGDAWGDKPDAPARTHATPPGAREVKAGPAHRGEALEAAPSRSGWGMEGDADGLRFSRAGRSPDAFVSAPDGSIDFGEITPEMAKVMRRQAGKIRLQQGVQNADGTGWGLAHIEANHGAQIRSLGFDGVPDFVARVAGGIQQVWQVPGSSQLLVTLKDGRKDVMYIQLGVSTSGDFYRVNSAFPVRQKDYESRKGMKKIWDGSEPTSAVTGQRPAFATAANASPEKSSSQGSSNARGQSGSSVANSEADGSDVRFSRAGTDEIERRFSETEEAYGGREGYERAKKAGRTKLNYRQWVQVRTPNFKRWFGDWEAIHAQAQLDAMKPVALDLPAHLRDASLTELRDSVRAHLDALAETGTVASNPVLGAVGFSKGNNKKAVSTGATPEKLQAARDIVNVIERGVHAGSAMSAKPDEARHGVVYHTLAAKVSAFGRPFVAVVTVKQSQDGQRFYNNIAVQAEQEKAPAAYPGEQQPNKDSGSATAFTGAGSSVLPAMRRVNPSSVSKVTDPDTGEPLVVYHGTNADFSAFNKEYQRAGQYGGRGFFFTTDPETAGLFGDAVMPVFLNARIGTLEKRRARAEGREVAVDHIRPQNDQRDIWVVFDSAQIKSATGNIGTFDGANPDIRRSFAGRNAIGADLHALSTAQRRIAAGEDAEAVRQETGWHRGADGKWRFEISDDQAAIAVGGDTAADVLDAAALDGGPVRVADVLDHPQLFAAYPHLADIRVEPMPAGERAAGRLQRTATGQRLQLRGDLKRTALASVMLHELQHAIQRAEGFATGGSKRALVSDLDPTGAQAYRLLAGEVEARNTQTRQRMTPAQRAAVAPEDTADVSPEDVIVTFNGDPVPSAPANVGASRLPVTERGLLRALNLQFKGLVAPVRAMLEKGRRGEKGGLVVIDSADPLRIAGVFSKKTGRALDATIELFSEAGTVNGFFDPRTGLTFLVGPNLDPVTAPAVLLHEMVHGQQRARIDQRAMDMLMERAKEKDAATRAFLDRVAQRMVDADAAADSKEAAAYIVEQAVIEGRSQGYTMADSRFFAWADSAFGKRVGDFLRSVAAMVRTWMIRHGGIKALTIDDLVGYAMAGVERAADGAVTTKGGSAASVRPDSLAGAIRAVIDAARNPGHAPQKAKLGSVADWLAEEARARAGLNIAGFTHVLDGSAVRHMLNRHTNPTIEKNRGQIPLTDADIAAAAEVIATPDQVVLGTKTQGHKDQIAYLKRQDDGSILYLEEVRTGRRELAAVSMRKYPAAKDFSDIVATLPSNARSDGGDGLIVVAPPGGGNIGGSLQSMTAQNAKRPGESGVGSVTTRPTSSAPTTTQRGDGAGLEASVVAGRSVGNDDIQFSRAGRSAAELARNIGDGLKAMTVQDVKRAGRHTLTDWLKVGLQFLGRRQLVDIYGKALPLAEYDRLVAQMEADKNDVGATADDLARRWGKLPDEGKLADLMHDATLAQIDADGDVPYAEGDDRAKSMVLKGRFRALSPEAQKVYREARDSYKRHHAEVRQAIIDRIMRSELRAEKRAELVRRMDADFFKAVKGVYFPLARFGQYVVVVKDGAGKVASVARAETMAEAEAMRDEMRRAFPAADGYQVGRVTLSKEFAASRDMVGRGFMTELYDALDKQNLPAAQLAELEDTLGQLYLSSLPDLSWAKHGIHRKGTPGFSQDARRAFAQNTFHGARYLAKLRYGDLMQTELDRMQKHVDQWSATEGFDQPRAQRVVDEMVKRHDALMSPKSNPISTALTSVGFVYYLGLSPAAAMVNLSQTALVAYPVMAAKWGFKKSGEALLKASAEAVAGKNDIRTQLKDADELAAYDAAVRAGTIDVTMSHDLAGIAQGEDAKVVWKMRPVMRLASGLFHHAERFNRQTTFIASYRLARETGATHLEAYEQATKATYDGHFDYSAGNRPRVMQGNVARVVLLFKQYAQNMIFTIARNAYQWAFGESPAVKKEARKVLGTLLALHAAAAGVLGLPLVGPLLTVASALGGDDDEPWDAEVALRNNMAEMFGAAFGEPAGRKFSEVVARGFSRLTPWDISGRVGLDKLLLPDVQEGLEGQRWAESFSTAMLGPVIGMGVNAAKAAQKMADGDYGRGLEDLLPIFARNPIKAARYWFEGAQDRTGIEIKGDVSLAGELGQFIGFSPSEVRLAFEGRSAVMDADRRLGERRSALMSQFARAAMEKDVEGMAEAREAIRAFNEKNPGRRITAPQMWQSVRSREKRIREAEDGVYLPRTRRDAMEAGRFAEV